MSRFAIFRAGKKINKSDRTTISKASTHNCRRVLEENVDSSRSHLNRYSYYGNARNVEESFNACIKDLNIDMGKVRDNQVIAREFICSFSPEMTDEIDIEKWIEVNRKFFEEKYSHDKKRGVFIGFEVHLDEKTPHIHAFVVPAVFKKRYGKEQWCLNEQEVHSHKSTKIARAMWQSAQDDYAKRMECFGLERGLKGSTAVHKTLKQHRSEIKEIKKEINKITKNLKNETKADAVSVENMSFLNPFNFKKLTQLVNKYTTKCSKLLNKYKAEIRHSETLQRKIDRLRDDSARTNRNYQNVLKAFDVSNTDELKKVAGELLEIKRERDTTKALEAAQKTAAVDYQKEVQPRAVVNKALPEQNKKPYRKNFEYDTFTP